MCGRFTLRAAPGVIAEQFSLFEQPEFKARFNIAPGQSIALIRAQGRSRGGAAGDRSQVTRFGGGREFAAARWGLVPAWAKDTALGNTLINARAETAAAKPAFRTAFRHRRCLIPADGFYEWRKRGREKQPYLFEMEDERPFAFAGLWEVWTPRAPQDMAANHIRDGEADTHRGALETCTILTTEANELLRPIHDRMPVIIDPAAYMEWLDPENVEPAALAPLLRPYAGDDLRAIAVSAQVNRPQYDGPECVKPMASVEDTPLLDRSAGGSGGGAP